VIPSSSGETYAIAWNGLVYRCVETGTDADLRADIGALVQALEARCRERRERAPDSPLTVLCPLPQSDRSEWSSVDTGSPMLLKLPLLLRLGEADLAEKVRLIVRAVYRQAKADDEPPAWRILRWRGDK
jgi:hypothetical protein